MQQQDVDQSPGALRPAPSTDVCRLPMCRGVLRRLDLLDRGVQLGQRVDVGDRDQVRAAEPAALVLDATLLVAAFLAGPAVEGVEAVVRAAGHPTLRLHS